jgi:nicotinamide riboside transporter PnuC
MFTIVSRIVGLIGIFYLMKNREWRPYGFLLIEVILIFTASYLYLGQSRFRVPLDPFLMLFTVIGILYMYRKFRKNIKSN